MQYIRELASYGKPVVLVLVSGRPRLLHDAVVVSTAVLNAYVSGTLLSVYQSICTYTMKSE